MTRNPAHLLPRSVDEALALRAQRPDATWVGGATALQLGWVGGHAACDLIDLQVLVRRACERPVWRGEGDAHRPALVLSAFAPLQALRRSPLLQAELPALAALLTQLASAPVRRLATLGGNLLWPAGDLGAAMLALGATLRFARGGERPAAAARDLPADDLLLEVALPVGAAAVFEKVGYRAAFSPTLVTIALVRDAGTVRAAVGGGPTPAQRLGAVEALVNAGGASPAALRQAVLDQMRTASDTLASAAERREVAARTIAGHLSPGAPAGGWSGALRGAPQ